MMGKRIINDVKMVSLWCHKTGIMFSFLLCFLLLLTGCVDVDLGGTTGPDGETDGSFLEYDSVFDEEINYVLQDDSEGTFETSSLLDEEENPLFNYYKNIDVNIKTDNKTMSIYLLSFQFYCDLPGEYFVNITLVENNDNDELDGSIAIVEKESLEINEGGAEFTASLNYSLKEQINSLKFVIELVDKEGDFISCKWAIDQAATLSIDGIFEDLIDENN